MGNINQIQNQPNIIVRQPHHLVRSITPCKPSTRTKLTYINPISYLIQDQPTVEQQQNIPNTQVVLEQIKVKWNSFIKMRQGNFLNQYDVRKQLGRGGFGCVYKVKGKYNGIIRAAKKIKKSDLDAKQHERLFNQVSILQSLDHPNIARLYEVYDHQDEYVLIMQLCEGGQLFKRIAKRQLSQKDSSKIMKQLLSALVYIHSKNIVHRDIKPQNILFDKTTGSIKLIDFGIAYRKKKPTEHLTSRIGTAYYIAPEVLCKKYDELCDLWASGVVLYMMLLHKPPFVGENQNEIMQSIIKDDVSFQCRQWNDLSSECKQLLSGLLKKKPKQRLSAQQALKNTWLESKQTQNIDKKIDKVMSKIQDFHFRNRLQAVVYSYAVSQLLTQSQKLQLEQIFKKLDTDFDGTISPPQFKAVMKSRIKDQERLNCILRLVDLDGSGKIEYTEFLISAINPREYLKKQHYQRSFDYFDIDHSGGITCEQLAKFLQGKQSADVIRNIFMQVDQNSDGTISRQQFVQLFMKSAIQKGKATSNNKTQSKKTNHSR